MKRVLELVTANCITLCVLIAIASVTTVEVKREYFFNGITQTGYTLKFFS